MWVSLVAGTMYRGQFEERLKKVIEEIISTKSMLFIDEVHMLVGAGAAGSSVDAANILKPALSRGELQVIGATTLDEYRKHIESDAALERRFQPILVEEPSIEETIQILQGVRARYEEHHKLLITDEALLAAADLAARYVPDRFMPDKAIDLIDEAGSRVRMYKAPYAANLRETFMSLSKLQKAKEEALETQRFDDAIDLRYQEVELEAKLTELREGWDENDNKPKVTAEDIAEVVAMWTGVPVSRIAGEENERLLEMEKVMQQRVIGQEEPIKAISKAVRRARAGLKDPRAPHRHLHVPGANRCRQDAAGQDAGRVHVWQRRSADQARHERVHGAPQRQPSGRRASRLCRLRRGRPADRGRAPPSLQRDPAGRDRKGASGSLQHAACRSWKMAICPTPRGAGSISATR